MSSVTPLFSALWVEYHADNEDWSDCMRSHAIKVIFLVMWFKWT